MHDQEGVIGTSLTELAFFLALAVLFVALFQERIDPAEYYALQQRLRETEAQLEETEAERDALREEIEALNQRIGELEARIAELESNRSQRTPDCTEAGVFEGFLFFTVITGRNSFLIDGEQLTLFGVLLAFQNEIAAAEQADCAHRIEVSHLDDIPLEEYLEALTGLERTFYVAKRPPISRQ